MDEPKLTDEEATAMLKRLTRHFNEPVKPLSKFCTAMRSWFKAVQQNNEDPTMLETQHGQTEPEYQFGSAYFKHLGMMNIDIAKSYLLARLMYEDEPLRTEKCPTHKGHWDGQTQLRYGCTYGCDGSGWLKTPEMVQARLERFRKHSKMTDAEVLAKGETKDILTREQWLERKPEAAFAYEEQRYLFEWLYHLGRIDLVPEGERG